MRKPIGIVGHPVIALALHRAILETEVGSLTSHREHLDVVVYCPQLRDHFSEKEYIYEATEVMRKMNVGNRFVDFPELDIARIREKYGDSAVPNRVPVLSLLNDINYIDTRLITGIEENILTKVPPEGMEATARYEYVMQLIITRADVIRYEASLKNGETKFRLPRNYNTPDDIMAQMSVDSNRHKKGLIAIQGGQGPEASQESAEYIAGKDKDISILLVSEPSVPNPFVYIMELLAHGMEHTAATLNPLPALERTSQQIDRVKPGHKFFPCNTLHYYDLQKISKIPVVHLIKEAIQIIPWGGKVLLLATEATVKSAVYQNIAEELGRGDIQYVTPMDRDIETDLIHQELVNQSINDVLLGQHKTGEKKLRKVVDHYRSTNGDEMLIMAGCTDLPAILHGIGGVIDPNLVTCNISIALINKESEKYKKTVDYDNALKGRRKYQFSRESEGEGLGFFG